MGHGLHDFSRHNAWATEQVITYCKGLDESTLNREMPGTYGTINTTLRHYINSEASYLFRISEVWPEYPWNLEKDIVALDVLQERAAMLAAAWEQFLAGDVDTEKPGEAPGDKGEIFAVPTGVFIAQAFHHGSEHRAQVSSILGTLGYEPPDVSAWGYAFATGRWTQTQEPNRS